MPRCFTATTARTSSSSGRPLRAGRAPGQQELVGYLANPLVLRADLHGDPTFTALLGRLQQTVFGALRHQEYPFSMLVERLRPVRDVSHAPLFQVSFAWEQFRRFRDGQDDAKPEQTALHLSSIHIAQGGAPDDLMMLVGELNGKLVCALQYNTDLFDQATIERMAGHFETMLRGIVANPDTRLSELPILTEAELRDQAEWNDTRVHYDAPDCLHEIVAETARRTPTAIAVSYEDRELTYAELDRRAETLAHRLQSIGVGPDIIVPVVLERSEDLVVALLAALKAGGAFMPIDPAQPTNRIAAILSNAPGAPVCITHERHLDHLAQFTGQPLCLDLPPVFRWQTTPRLRLQARRLPASLTSSTPPAPPVRPRGRSTLTAGSATGCCGCSRRTRSPPTTGCSSRHR